MSTFSSVRLDDALRDRLLDRLSLAHAARPLLPDDPRDAAARAGSAAAAVGLSTVRIRGTVSWRGVDVDHIWLAVQGGGDQPDWVLDVALPLHADTFAGALPGWVAGTMTTAELAVLAAAAPLEARVIGSVPDLATYRGRPVWGSTRN